MAIFPSFQTVGACLQNTKVDDYVKGRAAEVSHKQKLFAIGCMSTFGRPLFFLLTFGRMFIFIF